MIYNELDAPDEFYFVMEGKYDVGYNINRHRHWRLQFGDRTTLAAFHVANYRRINYNYRAHTQVFAYAIRRKEWLEIQRHHQYFTHLMNQKFVMFYFNNILKPMTAIK